MTCGCTKNSPTNFVRKSGSPVKAASPVFKAKATDDNTGYKKKSPVKSSRVFTSKGKCGAYYEKSPIAPVFTAKAVAVPIKTASPVKATSPRVFKAKAVSPVKATSPRVFKTKTAGKTTVKKTVKPVVTASPVAFISKSPVTDLSQQIQDSIRTSSIAIRKSIKNLHSNLNVLHRRAKKGELPGLKLKTRRTVRKNIRRSLRKERKNIRRSVRSARKNIRRSIATARKNILRSLLTAKKA